MLLTDYILTIAIVLYITDMIETNRLNNKENERRNLWKIPPLFKWGSFLLPRKQDTKLQLKNSDTKNYTPKYNDNSRPPSYDRKSRLEKGDDDKIYIKFWEHLDD